MSDVVKEYKYRNKVLRIVQDQNPLDPRGDDNFCVMVCFHKNYSLGDKHGINSNSFDSWTELKDYLIRECDAEVILPLRLYDHSGISMSTTANGQFGDVWDSGQVGFIYCTKAKMKECKCNAKKAAEWLIEEVKTYNQYLTGDIYGFQIVKKTKCDHGCIHEDIIDSCYGFYGDNIQTNGMLDHIEHFEKYKEVKNETH